jgi:hypothetical protein
MVNQHLFVWNNFSTLLKMGNTLSSINKTDTKNIQQPLLELGFVSYVKIPIGGGPFYIEAQPPKDGIYKFFIYHIDQKGTITEFFSFETAHLLMNEFKVMYDGSIVKFVFKTDSVEKGLEIILEYSFDFSKSFQSENDFSGCIKSIPFLLHSDRKMLHLDGTYWYYIIEVDATHYEFYIVESSDETPRGFETSFFKTGDTVMMIINVKSSNFPFVMNDSEGNFVIASEDKGFVPIPIDLPNDELTLAQVLALKSSQ